MFFQENRCLIHLRGRKTLLRPTGFVYYSLFSFLLMQQNVFHLVQKRNRKMCFFCSQIMVNSCCWSLKRSLMLQNTLHEWSGISNLQFYNKKLSILKTLDTMSNIEVCSHISVPQGLIFWNFNWNLCRKSKQISKTFEVIRH